MISDSNRKQIDLISKSRLNFNFDQKSLLLVGAHPGSNRLLKELSIKMAQDLEADFLNLDYPSIISSIRTMENNSTKDLEIPKFLNLDQKSDFTKAFFPGQYHIEDDNDGDENEDFDDIEDSDDDDYRIGSNLGSIRNDLNFSNPTKLFMNLTMAARDHKKGMGDSGIPNLIISGMPIKPEAMVEPLKANPSPFDIPIDDSQPELYLSHLYNEVKQTDRKLVIYLNDVTDIVQGSNRNTGKRLLIGLTQVVKQLKNVLLVVGSCPSIVEPKNLNQDINFYTQILDGNFYVYGPNGTRNYMAMNGTIFSTCLDNLSEFQKIPVLPPSFVYMMLQKNLDPTKSKVYENETELFQSNFSSYLMQMEVDMKLRIFELNQQSILQICKELNLKINDNLFASLHRKLFEFNRKPASAIIEILKTKVWTLNEIRQLVYLSAASCENDILTIDNITEGLTVIYETDFSRYATMSADEIDERMELIPEPITKSANTKQSDQKEPKHKSRTEALEQALKKRNVKLNQYEKKLLPSIVNPDHIPVTLNQLILPPQTKLVLQTLVTLPMLKPELFSTGVLSKSAIHGVLLFGPPGTGKTMLAKAISKSSGAYFMNISLANIFDKYVGEGEKNMQAAFSLARKLGGPVVIFFDEVDALFGSRRSDNGNTR